MKWLKIGLLVWLCGLTLVGCQAVYSTFPPSTKLHFRVAADINPDFDNRPSPVIIRVYELASKTVFENQDFFALYDSPETVLRTDLLKKDELVFEPGQRNEYRMALLPATKAVAVVAAMKKETRNERGNR